MTMRLLTVLLLFICIQVVAATGFGQRVTIACKNEQLEKVLKKIEQQTGYSFFYNDQLLKESKSVTLSVNDQSLTDVLPKLLMPNGLGYSIEGKIIVISKLKENVSTTPQRRSVVTTADPALNTVSTIANFVSVRGIIRDEEGSPIEGASILIEGTKKGTVTNDKGMFVIDAETGQTLMISAVGYEALQHKVKSVTAPINIILKRTVISEENIVVNTGLYARKKESFTGSSATFSGKELKMIGNQNILQSLRTLDPAFAINDNNEFGSDPNTLPDVNVRGKTSIIGLSQEFESDPNQPLFILDGYETTLRVINDLNIDRVESITILKDAAATAIYGSKSANGVIVIETKRPEGGRFKVNYSINNTVSFADLSDYNLMNSLEKLKFERLSGYYGDVDTNGDIILESSESAKYNMRLAEAKRGVNTYWMNEPLRVALTTSHNFYADGGDQKMRYGLGMTYGKTAGVMKGSDRNTINGNFRLIYRTGNFSFANNLNVDFVNANREPVNFSAYSSANPYFRKYDEYGDVLRVLESYTGGVWANENFGKTVKVFNPMYDASLNYLDRSPSFGFGNNLDIDWRVKPALRLRGRFGINKSNNKSERFVSPLHSQYDATNSLERGSYSASLNESMRYNGDFTATYGKMIAKKHLLNLVGGMRLEHSEAVTNGFTVRGFMEESYPNPAFSNGYATGARPVYSETARRSASYYSNIGYSYDNKYLFDGNFRSDGSSLFGVENQFTSTWATGLAWNVHNEKFMKYIPFISYLKLRASVGNPGNQNFDARMTMNIYTYNLQNQNPFGLSALISSWGNQNLDWQKTTDKNFGVDVEILDRKLRFNVDVFHKLTDPLLVFVDVPSSTGTSTVPKNMGSQTTKGFTVSANYQLLKTESSMWSINANARRLSMKYNDFGNSLDRYNVENRTRSLQRYYDGGSPSDMWAVRSAGIDPATGREIFIKKDGTQTFIHDYADEVIVGNTNPKVEGIIGTSYFYRGFNLAMNFRYKLGGQIQQSALFNKVENISMYSLKSNQDKRALYDRWQKPGDVAKYKGISLTDQTPMSDRFIADENVFSAESISLGYDFTSKKLTSIGISGLTVRGYMNQIFRISSVKEERGINFPFARSVSFSVSARF